MNTILMTSAGYAALQQEMKERLQLERPRFVERLQQAMTDDFNMSENAEYQAVIAEQAVNESRIIKLEETLAKSEVIHLAKGAGHVIRFGATVTLMDEDSRTKRTLQIVGEPEADASQGRISVSSPIARALIGKSCGDSVEVSAPAGTRSYKIQKVEWMDELRGA
jgi:transcription elongation factor GreA